MSNVVAIPSFGFTRRAIVRRSEGGPNMLVVRGMESRTVVVVCESDAPGSLRLRDYANEELVQVLDPAPYEASTTPGRCRICGCMEFSACMTEDGPCYWVEPDLCSGCVGKDGEGA